MKFFEVFSERVSKYVGSPVAFFLALSSVVIWALTGPLFHYSDQWQLIANTGTTLVTFLLGFVIANAQNRQQARDAAKIDRLERIETKIDEHVEQSIKLTQQIHAATPATGCDRHAPESLCVGCLREQAEQTMEDEVA